MKGKMLQQVMTRPGVIEFNEVDIPKVHEGEVLIKIMKIGICGSDVHVYHGEHPFTSYPVTQGHEVSGIVIELGESVTENRTESNHSATSSLWRVLSMQTWKIQFV